MVIGFCEGLVETLLYHIAFVVHGDSSWILDLFFSYWRPIQETGVDLERNICCIERQEFLHCLQ